MANSYQTHTGNGVTATFSWSQIDGYLSVSHIFVSVNGVTKTAGADYTLNTTAKTVTFTGGNTPPDQSFILIQRITPKTEAGLQTVFADGSVTTAADLNASQRQQLYIAQEAQDTGSGALPLDEQGTAWDAQGKRIGDMADPLALSDAATKAYVDSIALFGAYTVPQSWAFNGTGAQTAFVLSSPEPTAVDPRMFLVEVNGVLQRPTTNYDIVSVGSTYELQFTAAPSVGTGNIVVRNFGISRNALDVLPNGSVTNQYMAANAIATANLQDLAVTAAKLADLAVETAKLADGAVTALKLATGAVETAKLADGAVTVAKLGDNAVETAKIADLNVTAAKLANGAVEAAKIALAAVDFTKIKATGFASAGAANRLMISDASGNLLLAQLSLSGLTAPTAAFGMGGQKFSNLGAPSAAADSMRLGDLVSSKLVSFAYAASNVQVTGSDGTLWTRSVVGSDYRMTANSGNWVGALMRFELGNGTLQAVAVDSTAGAFLAVPTGGGPGASDGVFLVAVRVP